MRNSWQIGVMLGLALLGGQAAAYAQDGGTSSSAQDAGSSTSGTSDPAQPSDSPDDPEDSAPSPPRPPQRRTPYYNRMTTTRRSVVAAPSASARVGRSGAPPA